MTQFLFKKEIDYSLLKEGLTIPVKIQASLLDAIGVSLPRGNKTNIKIIINDAAYEAVLTNQKINNKEKYSNHQDIIQIRYSISNPIVPALRAIFQHSFNTFFNAGNTSDKSQPEEKSELETEINVKTQTSAEAAASLEAKEYLEVYAAGKGTLQLKCFPFNNAAHQTENSMKDAFLQYIGPPDSLDSYVRSYKLVFFKCFFELMDGVGTVAADSLAEAFRAYYLARKQRGLLPDKEVEPRIANIENSSAADALKVIYNQPFKYISERGFILRRQNASQKDVFYLAPQLVQELTAADIQDIRQLVDTKLALYFAAIDGQNLPLLHDIFERILNEYNKSKKETFAGHPLGKLFRSDLARLIEAQLPLQKQHSVKGSVGQGNWAAVPWLAIFDATITTSATKGVYIVYLLAEDGQRLYLTLMQGGSDLEDTLGKTAACSKMRQVKQEVTASIDCGSFLTDNSLFLGNGSKAQLYQAGCICYKEYRQHQVPDDAVLNADLVELLKIYRQYAELKSGLSMQAEVSTAERVLEGDERMTVAQIMQQIKNYIAAQGFTYNDGLIEDFYLCLKTKPFVILAGTSGTGKTRLVKLFAAAVGATVDNGRYKLVAVRPDWSDSSDLFGHCDLNGRFVPGAIIDFVLAAAADRQHPYFLCLDEMNLARVEYYLSDFLSIMETRVLREPRLPAEAGADAEHIVSDPLLTAQYYGTDAEAAIRYGTLRLPENLYIVGTVNMDETTFPFSRKVLDRANTIEFSYVNLLPPLLDELQMAPQAQHLSNSFFRAEYLQLAHCAGESDFVRKLCSELQDINRILQTANAHVGYRVRDEIVFYMLYNQQYQLLARDEALDYQLLQKILPRLQGSSAVVKKMLCELFKHCAGDYEGYQTEGADVGLQMSRAAQEPQCRYKLSAQKIAFMVRRYEEDGFTSYWI